jgi:hypothetical protein
MGRASTAARNEQGLNGQPDREKRAWDINLRALAEKSGRTHLLAEEREQALLGARVLNRRTDRRDRQHHGQRGEQLRIQNQPTRTRNGTHDTSRRKNMATSAESQRMDTNCTRRMFARGATSHQTTSDGPSSPRRICRRGSA